MVIRYDQQGAVIIYSERAEIDDTREAVQYYNLHIAAKRAEIQGTMQYIAGKYDAHYPVPCLIGTVLWLDNEESLEIIIEDCDPTFDPRLCISIAKPWTVFDGFVFDDLPHDSPNYR